jgi:heme A synthase
MLVLFQIHSVVRFLVLAAGLVAVVFYAVGLAQKRPATKAVRILGAIFVGLLDLQILLGVAVVLAGRWYPALIGHLVMMLLAAAVAHVLLARNRRKPQPGYNLPLVGVAVALVLIAGGIMAIGRGLFTVTAF